MGWGLFDAYSISTPGFRYEKKKKEPGNDLLSHGLPVVPSAQEGLTSVFGMGTGGTPLLWSPDSNYLLLCGICPAVCSEVSVIAPAFHRSPVVTDNLSFLSFLWNGRDW